MGTMLFKNNVQASLSSNMTDVQLTIPLATGHGTRFPTLGTGDYYYITLFDSSGNIEVCKVVSATGDTLTVEARGIDGTSAYAFQSADTKVEVRVPNIALKELVDDIAALQTEVAAIESGIHRTGNNVYFYNDTPPTGWSTVAGLEDTLIAVKGGTNAYNVTGGSGTPVGSWTQPTHVHSVPAHKHSILANSHDHEVLSTHLLHQHVVLDHVHTTLGHALVKAEIPPHTHGVAGTATADGAKANDFVVNVGQEAIQTTDGSANGLLGQEHDHGNTSVQTTTVYTDVSGPSSFDTEGHDSSFDTEDNSVGSTGVSTAPSSWRPQAAVGIIAEKD